jgi:hypothetical protein
MHRSPDRLPDPWLFDSEALHNRKNSTKERFAKRQRASLATSSQVA